MITSESMRGRIGLGVAHCAGLIDLVALPLWISVLIGQYKLDPQQAGLLLTIFLGAAVCASLVVAPLFSRLSGRLVAVIGYAGAALAIYQVSLTVDFSQMAIFHGLGGLCIGAALSVKDGTVARSENPHRLFSIMSAALGIFALIFLSTMPTVISQNGGTVLFAVFSGVMLIAAVTSIFAFPQPGVLTNNLEIEVQHDSHSRTIWLGIVGIGLMSFNQSMSFSFLEQVGATRGYEVEKINIILAVLGLLNLGIPVLAGFLQNVFSARTVLLVGPLIQGALVFTIFTATGFEFYAFAGSLFVGVMLFTHIFAFGYIAKLEKTGRVLAATPAVMMTGAALGPALGGTLAKFLDYSAVGIAALCVAFISAFLFSKLPKADKN